MMMGWFVLACWRRVARGVLLSYFLVADVVIDIE